MVGYTNMQPTINQYVFPNYFVAASSFFIITNMKSAESRQRPRNTDHTIHNGMLPQRKPPTETNRFPIAVATNQHPIIMPLYLGGATFDTNEIPIGERSSSANVSTRYVEISQFAEQNTPASPASIAAF